jgi:hypothetical protein
MHFKSDTKWNSYGGLRYLQERVKTVSLNWDSQPTPSGVISRVVCAERGQDGTALRSDNYRETLPEHFVIPPWQPHLHSSIPLFGRFHKAKSVCRSVLPHGTERLHPNDGFSWNYAFFRNKNNCDKCRWHSATAVVTKWNTLNAKCKEFNSW